MKQARKPMNHQDMMETLDTMAREFPFLSVTYLGESMMGRGIPVLTFGEGAKSVVYVGGIHGTEWGSTVLLLRMARDFCALYDSGGRMLNYTLDYLFRSRTIYVIPMLNPDGVEYALHGVSPEHILYQRLLKMNDGKVNFGHWKSNARGVDLERNFSYGFGEYKMLEADNGVLGGAPFGYSGESAESEPETGHFCNFLRYHRNIKTILSFHMEGEGIYMAAEGNSVNRARTIGEVLSLKSGYRIQHHSESESLGSLIDWCQSELQIPAFSVACGKNEKENSDFFLTYSRLKEMLFMVPTLI